MSTNKHKHRSNSRSRSPPNHKLRISSDSSKARHKKRSHHKKSHKKRSRSRSISSQYSSSASRSRSRSRKKRKKKSKHKHKHRSRSRSLSSDTDYTSDSSDSHYQKRKKRKKSKKKKRDKKRKKSKHKKSKHKKHKKKRQKRDKTLLEGNMSIYKPSEYREGEHGFITANDYFAKMPEFTSWLAEVNNVYFDSLGKRETKEWFAKFCDDWNTSTMCDDKYYDLDKWNRANGGGPNESVMDYQMSDEQRLSNAMREERQSVQDKRYAARVHEMKRQLIDLKSHNKHKFDSITDQHVPRKETFESLAAKRKAKKVEDRLKRFGKFDVFLD